MLLLGLLAAAGPVAARADTTIVQATVHRAGGAVLPDSVTLGALQADPQRCPQYGPSTMFEHGRQGNLTEPLPQAGPQTGTWSLASILACLQTPIAAGEVTEVSIIGSDGAPEAAPFSQLGPADLAAPSEFANPGDAAVVSSQGSTVQYNRPWRGRVSDFDFQDQVETAPPLQIEVYEGPSLQVSLDASPSTVTTGGAIGFSATVAGGHAGALSYAWDFGGGAPRSGIQRPLETFATGGVYAVAVRVTDAGGGIGTASTAITVNPPGGPSPTRSGSAGTPGNGTSGASPTGPITSAGSTPGAGAGAPSAGRGGRQRGGSAGGSSRAGAAPRRGATTGGATATHAGIGAAGRATGAAPNRSAGRRGGAGRRHAPARPPLRRSPPTAPGARLVSGRLIGDVVTLPPDASPLVRRVVAAAATAPAVRRGVHASLVPGLAAALAIVVLLGLGAGRELRGRRAWRALTLRA